MQTHALLVWTHTELVPASRDPKRLTPGETGRRV